MRSSYGMIEAATMLGVTVASVKHLLHMNLLESVSSQANSKITGDSLHALMKDLACAESRRMFCNPPSTNKDHADD